MRENVNRLGSLNLGNLSKTAAMACPDKEALIDANVGKRCTYKELNERANSIANGFLSLGIKKGDFVSLLLMNCAEFVELHHALAKTGAILAPLNYRLSPKELESLINYSDSKALVFGRDFKPLLGDMKIGVEKYIVVGEESEGDLIGYEELAKYPSDEPSIEIDEDDVELLEFTSGTTGLPKGYLLTHYMQSTAAIPVIANHDLTFNDRVLIVFPMYGRVGWAWMFGPAVVRATICLMDFEPKRFLETVQEEKITWVNLVPTMAQMILSYPDLGKYDLSSLRGVVFAGAPLPISIYEEARKKISPNVYEYYGMQETAVLVAIRPEEKIKRPSSCGAPVNIIDLKIVDDRGKDLSVGEVGEVITRGPSITTGYYKQEDKTRETFKEGWLYTGDLGKFDEGGYLYLMGRKKDMIVSGAQNVFAIEVEEALLHNPKVAECAVIGLPDEKWGERVTAVLKLKEDEKATEDEMIDYCREKMAHFKAPKSVFFTDVIPKNPAGKVQKFLLVEKYEGGKK